jgi:cell wall-associated NlpC family hydrolase
MRQRIGVVAAAVLGAGLLLAIPSSAGAAPAPTITQVEKKIRQLQVQGDQLGQQYDQVKQELATTKQRLILVRKQLSIEDGQFARLRTQIASIAVTEYEDGNLNSSLTLLTTRSPQAILNQSSILEQLSESNNAEIGQFLAAARQLASTQEVASRTVTGIEELKANLGKRKATLTKMLDNQNALLAELSPVQQVQLGGGTETGTQKVKYTGPTSSQADKAVQFAYDQVGCPYVYGGTGPCDDGFDCSGLTMMSWAAAGISIPRTSYEQWDDLPHVSLSDVEPGDILVFFDAGHVALYVGGGKFIQAPQPGEDVQIVAYQGASTPGIDGAVRP